MKNLNLLFIALLLLQLNTLAQSGWFWQNPLPQGNNLNDIWPIHENTAIAVGNNGMILRSNNSGQDWTQLQSNTTYPLYSIHFINENIGFVSGKKIIMKTTDGGDNWAVLKEVPNSEILFKKIHFINENTGWIIEQDVNSLNDSDKLLKTTDGGWEWINQNLPGAYNFRYLYSFCFISENKGWIAGGDAEMYQWPQSSTLFKTTNGGNNWELIQSINASYVNCVSFVNDSVGWAHTISYGMLSQIWAIMKTTDGGYTWNEQFSQPSPFQGPLIHTINFYDSNNGCAVGFLGAIFITTNSGADWLDNSIDSTFNLSCIKHYNESYIYAVGENGDMTMSSNGGTDWNELSDGFYSGNLRSVFFADKDNGWAVGEYDIVVIRTTNGGDEWIEEEDIPEDRWQYVFFIDINTGWIGGDWGRIIKTTNGGEDWIEQYYNNHISINSIYFLNENIGWASGQGSSSIGGGGVVLRTINGGTDWILDEEIYGNYLYSIYFVDENIGWACGQEKFHAGGTLIKTTNGGDDWILHPSNFDGSIFEVVFADVNNGWLAANSGVYKTTDGGTNWIQYLAGGGFRSIFFIDSHRGWVTSFDGNIYYTTNGGDYWQFQEKITSNYCNSIFFIDENTGWLVGRGGNILKTTTGGVSFVEQKEINEIPTNYLLSNNFPNPFNPSTKIIYAIPQLSQVVIKIFDILGKEIETLVNEEKPVGTYEITWYAEELPSGVYFYQLKAGSIVETKKMILIK